MVGKLKPYLMKNNLFELFTLTASGEAQTLGMNAGTISHAMAGTKAQAIVAEPPGGISTT